MKAGLLRLLLCALGVILLVPFWPVYSIQAVDPLPAPELVSPVQGAGDVPISPTFSWTTVSGAGIYRVLLAADESYLPADIDSQSAPGCLLIKKVTTTTYTLESSLDYNTTYYWEVQGLVMDGETVEQAGEFSVHGVFTTAAPPLLAAPVLASPENDAAEVPVIPTFSWSEVSGANLYWLLVAVNESDLPTDINAESAPNCVINKNVSSTSYTPTTSLSVNTTYYWEVQGFNWNGSSVERQGDFSLHGKFTTVALEPLPAPELISPEYDAADVPITPTFSWSAVSGATTYWLLVSTDESCLPDDINAASAPGCVISKNVSSTGYTPTSSLEADTVYYWEVQSFILDGATTVRQGYYSSHGKFKTATVPILPGPSLLSPENNATGVSTAPVFSWSEVSGANTYWLLAAKDESLLPTDINAASAPGCVISKNVTATSYTAPLLLDINTTYYWEVQGFTLDGWVAVQQGYYSEHGVFTTGDRHAGTQSMKVWGQNAWTDTGLNLVEDEQLFISANGLVYIDGSGDGKSPDGLEADPAADNFAAPGLPKFALIGKIDDGSPFLVGSALYIPSTQAGRLYLSVNDETAYFIDNSGYWNVTFAFSPPTCTLNYLAGSHGSLSGEAEQTIVSGQSGSPVSAVADTGYHFVDWSDGLSDNPRTDSGVIADISVTANFSLDPVENVTLRMSVENTTVLKGDTFSLSVSAECGDQRVDEITVYLDFDPQYLAAKSAEAGDALPGTLIAPEFDNATGTFAFSANSAGGYPSGNFTVVSITFEALQATDNPTPVLFHTVSPRETRVDWVDIRITGNLYGEDIRIEPAVLTALEVSPGADSAPRGETRQLTATGIYSDGSRMDLTELAAWSSADPERAPVDAGGLVTAKEVTEGEIEIYAVYGAFSGTARITVTPAVLFRLMVAPQEVSLARGMIQRFSVTGVYTDQTSLDCTSSVTWSSSDPALTIDADGVARVDNFSAVPVTVYAVSGQVSDCASLYIRPEVLRSIEVSPGEARIATGRSQAFTATGQFSDNTSLDISSHVYWTSSNPAAADIDFYGLARGSAAGVTEIRAGADNLSSPAANLTVTAPVLEQITISTHALGPFYAGNRLQFYAEGRNSDNSSADLAGILTWSSSDSAVAVVNGSGLVKTIAAGSVVITARAVSADSSLIVSNTLEPDIHPAVVENIRIIPGEACLPWKVDNQTGRQYTAIAVYSDGSSLDITSAADWNSSDENVAETSSDGLVTLRGAGSTDITAVWAGISSETGHLTVYPDNLGPTVIIDYPAEGAIVYSSEVTLKGRVDDVKTELEIVLNGINPVETSGLILNGESGEFSCPVVLRPGCNSIRIKARDGNGNYGSSLTQEVFYEDNATNPAVLVITQPHNRQIVRESELMIEGTVENATAVTIRLNGVDLEPTAVNAGQFSRTVTLMEGDNVITAVVYAEGSDSEIRGSSGTLGVELDTTAPVISLQSPANGAVVNSRAMDLKGRVDDPTVQAVSVRHAWGADRDNVTEQEFSIPVNCGRFDYPLALVQGHNWYTLFVSDRAGNWATAGPVQIDLDYNVPQCELTCPDWSDWSIGYNSLNIEGLVDDLALSTARLTLNGVEQTVNLTDYGYFSRPVTLTSGANTVQLTAGLDGCTGTSGQYTVIVDTIAPDLTIDIGEPAESLVITVTASEALADGYPVVTLTGDNQTLPVEMTGVGVKTWSGALRNEDGAPRGDFQVWVEGVDLAGNGSLRQADVIKGQVEVVQGETVKVGNQYISLKMEGRGDNLTVGDISLRRHYTNPSGQAGHPAGAPNAAVFVDIEAGPELREGLLADNLSLDLIVSYDPAELPARTVESTLGLYRWDTTRGLWDKLENCSVDVDNHTLSSRITHLSSFGVFSPVSYSLTLTNQGRGRVNPAVGTYTYTDGTSVTLTATPDSGYRFSRWSGDLSGTTNPVTFTMDADKAVTAIFYAKTSSGSGGGGGSSTSPAAITLNGCSANTTFKLNSQGRLESPLEIQSTDGGVKLELSQGTRCLTSNGSQLTRLSMESLSLTAAAPEGEIVVKAYTFGPEGAQFDPELRLGMLYQPAALPAGMEAGSLYIAVLNGTEWQKINSSLEIDSNTVWVAVTHFSEYALIGSISPAEVTVVPVTTTATATPTPTTTTATADKPVEATPTQSSTPGGTLSAENTPAVSQTSAGNSVETLPETGSETPWGLMLGIIGGAAVIVLVFVIISVNRKKRT